MNNSFKESLIGLVILCFSLTAGITNTVYQSYNTELPHTQAVQAVDTTMNQLRKTVGRVRAAKSETVANGKLKQKK